MIRTLKIDLQYDADNSQAIGYMASQQNLAYNETVHFLNQQSHLPPPSGPHYPDALRQRIAEWRQEDPRAQAPYPIHQAGSEQAWAAYQRLREAGAETQAQGEEPADGHVHAQRRTLSFRSRKDSQFSLSVIDPALFQISADGRTIASVPCGFTLRLHTAQTLQNCDVRSFRLVPVKRYAGRTPFSRRHYHLHAQVWAPNPPQ